MCVRAEGGGVSRGGGGCGGGGGSVSLLTDCVSVGREPAVTMWFKDLLSARVCIISSRDLYVTECACVRACAGAGVLVHVNAVRDLTAAVR